MDGGGGGGGESFSNLAVGMHPEGSAAGHAAAAHMS